MSRAYKGTSKAPGFYGHGISIGNVQSGTNDNEIERLTQENEQLREQLQYHQQLLHIWHQQPCTLCQLNRHAASTSSGATATPTGRSTARGITASGSEAGGSISNSGSSGDRSGGAPSPAVQSQLDKALRQQQVLIAQLQRQVMVLEVELSSREQLVLEADAVLAESSRRLAHLAALQQTTAGFSSSSSSNSRPARGAAAGTAAAGGVGGGIAGRTAGHSSSAVVAVADQVLEQVQDVCAWCKTAAARISRARAESATKCRAARSKAGSAAATSSSQWDREEEGLVSSLQQLQLQYIPAGGNKFLKPSSGTLSLPAIAQGQGLTALDTAALHSLLLQLASLAQPLAHLAVQLRSTVLPVLPWLAAGAGEQQLPGTCAVLAESAAAAAGELVELCSVLPAVAGALSGRAADATSRAAAARAAAARAAGSWGSSMESAGQAADATAAASDQFAFSLDANDQQLLDDLTEQVLGRCRGNSSRSNSSRAGGFGISGSISSSSRRTAAGSTSASPGPKPHDQQQQQQLGRPLLQQLQRRWQVMWFKKQVLEQQLGFVARCSAEQAKLVSSLVQQVASALAAAAEAHEAVHGLQQRRAAALQFLLQLQRAALLLQQRPKGEGSGSSSALRGLAGLLQQQWEVLEDLPDLLHVSGAHTLKAAALDAVADAFEAFRLSLHTAQEHCNSATQQLKHAAVA